MSQNQDRHPAGAPTGGQYAAMNRPGADASAALQPPVTPAKLGLEVGQERFLDGVQTDALLENVRIARTEDGYELRGDVWQDLTELYGEAFEGLDVDAREVMDKSQVERANFFLNGHRGAIDEFFKDRWGVDHDDTTEWDHTRLIFRVPVDADVDLDEAGIVLDEAEGPAKFFDEASFIGQPGDLVSDFRDLGQA